MERPKYTMYNIFILIRSVSLECSPWNHWLCDCVMKLTPQWQKDKENTSSYVRAKSQHISKTFMSCTQHWHWMETPSIKACSWINSSSVPLKAICNYMIITLTSKYFWPVHIRLGMMLAILVEFNVWCSPTPLHPHSPPPHPHV